MDQDLKSLIIAGDSGMINDFLKEIHSLYSNLPGKRMNSNASQTQLENQSKQHRSKSHLAS